MEFDLDTVDRLLSTTRAVRRRLDLTRPVPREVIRHCVELATRAPSAADAQNWRWVVVTDPERRWAIADARRRGDVEFLGAEVARLGPGAERRRLESSLYLLEHLHEVPALVLVYVVDPGLPGLGGQRMPPALLYGSVFPAIWSFQLALRSRRVGSTLMGVVDEKPLSAIVGAPDHARIASLLPVAYYTGETFRPAPRRPVDDVLSWERWPD
jgi:nitroreductase